MTNGITYDPQNKRWIMQCGSTTVPIRCLDKNNKPVLPDDRGKTAVSLEDLDHG